MTAEHVPYPRLYQPVRDHHDVDDGWVEFTVGAALAYGWGRFWSSAPIWLGLVVAWLAANVAVEYVGNGFAFEGVRSFGWSGEYSPGAVAGVFATVLVNVLAAAVMTRAALAHTYGQAPSFPEIVRFVDPSAVLLSGVLLAVGCTVGTLLLVVPALVFAFFAFYTIPFVLDHDQDAVAAVRSSFAFVSANAGRFLMLAVAVVALNLAGALFFGLGLLLTVPVTLIATTHAFRTLQGERVG